MMKRTRIYSLLSPLILIWVLAGCASSRSLSYFDDIPDSMITAQVLKKDSFSPPEIEPGDQLQVRIYTLDPNTAQIINPPAGGSGKDAQHAFLVDEQGMIHLPLVGQVRVGGSDLGDARRRILTQAAKNLVDPVVEVSFAHFSITVLGEVARPGRFEAPTDKVSVLQALGMAGDLTIQARRENVLLLREKEGNQQLVYRYNLNDSKLFESDYYYLRPGDVLYVSPNRAKSKASVTDLTKERYIGYGISGFSVLFAVFSLILINSK